MQQKLREINQSANEITLINYCKEKWANMTEHDKISYEDIKENINNNVVKKEINDNVKED